MTRSCLVLFAVLCQAALAPSSRCEIIDRIAVTVDDDVITVSEIQRQIRLTAFQNHEKPDFSPDAKREAADKLVEQIFIRREIETARYSLGEQVNPDPVLLQLKEMYGGEAAFQKALVEYGLTEAEVREQLKWQLTLVPFIDVRFKPGIQVPDSELHEYYDKTYLPEWKKTGTGTPPTFQESRDAIESILAAQRADQALDFWLGQARRQARIRYHREAFQ